jgi:hypothetical protein
MQGPKFTNLLNEGSASAVRLNSLAAVARSNVYGISGLRECSGSLKSWNEILWHQHDKIREKLVGLTRITIAGQCFFSASITFLSVSLGGSANLMAAWSKTDRGSKNVEGV